MLPRQEKSQGQCFCFATDILTEAHIKQVIKNIVDGKEE